MPYRVSTSQVHADATAPGAEDEDEYLGIGVETLHENLQAEPSPSSLRVQLAPTNLGKLTALACHRHGLEGQKNSSPDVFPAL